MRGVGGGAQPHVVDRETGSFGAALLHVLVLHISLCRVGIGAHQPDPIFERYQPGSGLVDGIDRRVASLVLHPVAAGPGLVELLVAAPRLCGGHPLAQHHLADVVEVEVLGDRRVGHRHHCLALPAVDAVREARVEVGDAVAVFSAPGVDPGHAAAAAEAEFEVGVVVELGVGGRLRPIASSGGRLLEGLVVEDVQQQVVQVAVVDLPHGRPGGEDITLDLDGDGLEVVPGGIVTVEGALGPDTVDLDRDVRDLAGVPAPPLLDQGRRAPARSRPAAAT